MDEDQIIELRSTPKVLVTSQRHLPNGQFALTGKPLSGLPGGVIGWLGDKPAGLYSIAEAPRQHVQINNVTIQQTLKEAESDEKKRLTPKRANEALTGVGEMLTKGTIALGATHLAQKGGVAVATPLLADKLGVASDANATAILQQTLESAGGPGSLEVLGNIFKILIFAFTLFGVSLKILEFVFDDEVPAWAWITTSAINLVLVTVFGLWLFDTGPFATAS